MNPLSPEAVKGIYEAVAAGRQQPEHGIVVADVRRIPYREKNVQAFVVYPR